MDLAHQVKPGATTPQELTNLAKGIWFLLLSQSITIIGEYFPGSLNMNPDHVSCHFQDRNNWLLCKETFQKI